jgi:hypothetical protein
MSSEEEQTPLFTRSNRGTSHWNRLKKSTMVKKKKKGNCVRNKLENL